MIVSYRYRILDRDKREILADHWHPTGASPVMYPHLHLSTIPSGRDADPVALAEMHLPTAMVALADLVRVLITDFRVAPRRDDWTEILDAELARA